VVNPTTTAVALIDREDAATAYADVIGKVTGANFDQVSAFTSHLAPEITARVAAVTAQLQQDVDPVGDRPAASGIMAPDDAGDGALHHDYQLTKGGVTSTFVWIPVFTAYQLSNPVGAGYPALPVGSWVKNVPGGTEDVHWVRETFGGFYVAKYEASRADAVQGAAGTGEGATVGTSSTLKVQARCVPWGGVKWDEAGAACVAYDAHSHLMRDDEWTALAVWSMINGLTVYGNNSGDLRDVGDNAVTFIEDPNQAGRALTGTGTKAGWTGDTNLTTHAGTTAGVYDLNGNMWEWTETVGAAQGSGNFLINGMDTGLKTPQGYITALSTDPRLRRYGLPGAVGSVTPTFGGDYHWLDTVASIKMYRGGSWYQGGDAGVWTTDIDESRSTSKAHLGFRPVLSFR
jgi:hypothetical protein